MELYYDDLPGLISGSALHRHLELYHSYIEEAQGMLGPCPRTDAFLYGAIRLHEAYFEQFSLEPRREPEGRLLVAINRNFGSVEVLWGAMLQKAQCTRGWVVLAATRGKPPRILTLDSHEEGAERWTPLVTIDCYEHAYWEDFGPDRHAYLAGVPKYLDWTYPEKEYQELNQKR